jgi:hypothetical protein
MPLVGKLMGAKIFIYYQDHNPPHVHVVQSEHAAEVSIETQEVIEGRIPLKLKKQAINWIRDHAEELMDRWNLAKSGTEFEPIDEEYDDDAFYR